MISVGSRVFFSGMPGFESKDFDYLELIDNPKSFHVCRQILNGTHDIFYWKNMSADEFVAVALERGDVLEACKFLVPEFCEAVGITISHLAQLEPLLKEIVGKHAYVSVIYNAYIVNNSFTLTDEQRAEAYRVYKETRGYEI